MAKKTTNPTNLMSYDFLPNVGGGGNTMNNLFNQLMKLGEAQRQEPIAKQEATQALFKPISAYLDEANEKIVDGMVEYKEKNPELEEGLLFQGTEAAIGEALEANSVEFKELNRKLAYMSPSSPGYAKTVAKMNKINKDNVALRDQNKKLLDIHNLLLTDRVQSISGANEAGMAKMFEDIQQDKTDNFSVRDGQIIWTNPDKNGLQREIKVSGIKADGPILKTDVSNVYDLKTKFQETPAALLDPSDAASKVGTQIKGLGKDGFSSMVWDNLNGNNAKYSKDNKFYNTQRLINDFEKTLGVTLSADEENRLKKEGPNYKFQTGSITFGDYTDKWVANEMLKEKKAGKGLPEKEEINNRNNYVIDKQFVPVADVQPTVDLLNKNLKNLDPQTSWNGITWRIVNGQYQFFNTAENKYQDIDKNELIARGFKLGSQHGIQTGGVMDLNNDGQISKQEFNNFMGKSSSSNLIFPTLQLAKK